jgi:hypothetical protein
MRRIPGRRLAYALFVLLLLANVAMLAVVWRDRGRARGGGPPPAMVRNLLVRELGFDADQTSRYDALVAAHRRVADSLRRAIGRTKRDNADLLQDTAATDARLEAGAGRTATLVRHLELATLRHFREVRALCRPGQRPRFDSLVREAFLRLGPGGGPSGRPGMPR